MNSQESLGKPLLEDDLYHLGQETGGTSDSKSIFTEVVPMIGRVPMLFYIPDSLHSEGLRSMVEDHGGICIFIVECCVFQIWPEHEDSDSNEQKLLE
jgi:hypothetical protein